MWEPGDTSADGLQQAATEVGNLQIELRDLQHQWTGFWHEGLLAAYEEDPTRPECVLKSLAWEYAREKNPDVYRQLATTEGRLDALLGTCKVLVSAKRSSYYSHQTEGSAIGT